MVELRPFERSDFSLLIAWTGSPESLFQWAGSSFRHPLDHPQLERHLDESPAPQLDRLLFTALEEGTGEPVAHIELERIDRQRRSATVCLLAVAPEARGRGIGTATISAVLEKAFGELRLHRLELRVFEGNAAVAIYQRLGFVREGLLREVALGPGGHRSAIVMSVLEQEWRGGPAPDLVSALASTRPSDA